MGREASVKFLLRENNRRRRRNERSAWSYVDGSRDDDSRNSPMLLAIFSGRPCSPRVVRLLLDAGVDTVRTFSV